MKLPPGYVPGLLTQHKATAKGGFGEKLLRQFGWTEGKGLGAKEDGMAEALKVKQKKDQTGVSEHSGLTAAAAVLAIFRRVTQQTTRFAPRRWAPMAARCGGTSGGRRRMRRA